MKYSKMNDGGSMFFYRIAEVVLKSECRLPSFERFISDECEADITLERAEELPLEGMDSTSGSIIHRRLKDGWFFHGPDSDKVGVYVSEDYSFLKILGEQGNVVQGMNEWYVRIAVECMLARRGYVSLHAAAVEVRGEAFAFTGPSGIGKSTRAMAWIEGLDANLINGDRPLIDVQKLELYGVPWDGKEQCFKNVHYPLKAVCEIRRSESVYVRDMNFAQRRKILMTQCFLPMWDTETAAIQMANILLFAKEVNMVRVFCGPSEEDAHTIFSVLQNKNQLREANDMKVKQGFVLRNVVGEHILMPTGDMISKFNGTILLNDVSAFVWEKMQNPVSKDDLLKAILDEYEVEKSTAAADLDALLQTLTEYGVIEYD